MIDYTRQDFTKNGQTYDAILDAVGNLSFSHCRGSLKRGGVYLATDGLQNLFLSVWTTLIGDKRVRFPIPPRFTKKDVVFLKELIEAGRYRAVIDRRYPLEQVVEATRYVETKTEDRERSPDRQPRQSDLTTPSLLGRGNRSETTFRSARSPATGQHRASAAVRRLEGRA